MCFSFQMSAALAGLGVGAAGGVWWQSRNTKLTIAILYFTLMEALQAIQYLFIADNLNDSKCQTVANRGLTLLGYIHICFQPYFTNLYFQSCRPALGKAWPHEEVAWKIIGRLCLAQACLGLLRLNGNGDSLDMLDGPTLCTYKGTLHLAWSLPLKYPSYFLPGLGLQCFMMFVPVLAIGGLAEIDAVTFLFATGPLLATYLTTNRHEVASIWCFFSTTQCAIGAASALARIPSNSKV